jgi:nuclear transport factor 2 (NTF2) superfamily protein
VIKVLRLSHNWPEEQTILQWRNGLMRRREASINDVAITDTERRFLSPAPGPRPADHPGIPDIR